MVMQINTEISRDQVPTVGGYGEWDFDEGWAEILLFLGRFAFRIHIKGMSRT